MTRFVLILTIASLSIANAGFAFAQAAISEPGAYAFYHPDGDVLHAGPQYGAHAESYGASGVGGAMAAVVHPAHGHKHGRAQ